jgi:hypothetical protein
VIMRRSALIISAGTAGSASERDSTRQPSGGDTAHGGAGPTTSPQGEGRVARQSVQGCTNQLARLALSARPVCAPLHQPQRERAQ